MRKRTLNDKIINDYPFKFNPKFINAKNLVFLYLFGNGTIALGNFIYDEKQKAYKKILGSDEFESLIIKKKILFENENFTLAMDEDRIANRDYSSVFN
jgi:hypothetical protein